MSLLVEACRMFGTNQLTNKQDCFSSKTHKQLSTEIQNWNFPFLNVCEINIQELRAYIILHFGTYRSI